MIDNFMALLAGSDSIAPLIDNAFVEVAPEYGISVGELAEQLKRFKATRDVYRAGGQGAGTRLVFHLCQLSAARAL